MDIHLKLPRLPRAVSVRIAAGTLLLLIGILGMTALAGLKEAPPESTNKEPSLRVQTVTVKPEDVQARITGYGEIRPLDVVSIAPEIPGRISYVHPRLETGEVVKQGEVLFRIDPADYGALCKQAHAQVDLCENAITKLQIQHAADLKRLNAIERNRQLAKLNLDRMQSLYELYGVVAQSQVEAAEQSYNSVSELHDQLVEAVELHPIQAKDMSDRLAAAKAELRIAQSNLERCVVSAPYDGRVKDVSVEVGQYVVPGLHAVTLANDEILEIHAPIDSRDAQQWLRFKDNGSQENAVWFSSLENVACRIRWTEDQSDECWKGRLHRVVEFDQQTRTLVVAIRVDSRDALSKSSKKLPLVEGMFCSVEISGRTIPGVFRVPRKAVSFENTVYVSNNGRLKTIPVRVTRMEGDEAIVTDGLESGDIVITTKLENPLENCLLETGKETDGEDT